MTVLLDDGQADAGTHVLLIGVGHYPYLKGGTEVPFPLHMEMGQLSSPPESVRALSAWLMDGASGFHNPERPLRSLQVLCSAAGGLSIPNAEGAPTPVDAARVGPVKQAIADWMGRANRSSDNAALFFFCGHGLAFGEAENSLLLEEFGRNANDPLDDALAFDEMRMGVIGRCSANHQIHLIDACRTPPSRTFLDTYGSKSTGVPMVAGGFSRRVRDKNAPVFFATGLASSAYGLNNKPSLFTQGFLQSMRGPASRDKGDHWAVQVPALAEGINKCVASMAYERQPQYCQPLATGSELTIHKLRAEPESIVKVYTRDPALLPATILAHVAEATQVRGQRQPPEATPWWVTLATGAYRFEAVDVADGTTVMGQKQRYVVPPGAEVAL